MCQSHIKGGQEKDHSQQMPTFGCSELPILEICIAKILLLSSHVAMWWALAHPVTIHCLLWVSNCANDASQTPALKWERVYIYRPGCGGAWHQYAGHWMINFVGNYWVRKSQLWKLRGVLEHPKHPPGYAPVLISQVCRYCLLKLLLQTRRRLWHQRKGSIYSLYKWANTACWQRYDRKN